MTDLAVHSSFIHVYPSVHKRVMSPMQFFTPVPRPEGWIVIFWDMVTRTIFVVDPMYSKKSQPLTTQHRDEILAWKLHGALFSCVNEYYAGWPVSKDRWTIQFPALADSIFSRYSFQHPYFLDAPMRNFIDFLLI